MTILLIGLSHKTTPVEVREQLAFTPAMLRSALTHFDANHRQAHLEEVHEGVILSTCNRLEVYTVVGNPAVAQEAIIQFLSHSCEVEPELFVDHLYVCQDEAAVSHLLHVAAGLDSLVLGEPQILGQITQAYEAALAQRAVATVLSRLFQTAIHTGKRVRTETAISVNPASISSVAASLAAQLLGDLAERRVLLIGAGEMGAIAVRALIKRGAAQIMVANRTFRNGEQLAKAWGGKAITFQQLDEGMAWADIIVTSTGAPHTILNRELLAPTMAARSERPLYIIDIAVPRDVDPDVTTLPNVHLNDIDDLQALADHNRYEREQEIPQAKQIVAEEVANFLKWLASLDVVSTITDLRQYIEEVRQRELERLFNRLDLDEQEQAQVAAMCHRLINKILHEPTLRLKREAVMGNGVAYTSAVRYLFSLDHEESN